MLTPPNIFATPHLCMVEGGLLKGLGGKSQMMCGITCFRGFGQIDHLMVVHLMVVYPIVHLTTSFKILDDKKPKVFPSINY
jgi:hypothetical protein